jgi:hypothetical protein
VIEPVAPGAARSGPLAPSGAAVGGSATARGSADATRSADPVSRGFEQLLVRQLAKELLATTGHAGNAYASLLPDALASAVEDAGGLGLDLKVAGS